MPSNCVQSLDHRRDVCIAYNEFPSAGNGLTLHKVDPNEHPALLVQLTDLTQARTILSPGILKFGADTDTGGYWS